MSWVELCMLRFVHLFICYQKYIEFLILIIIFRLQKSCYRGTDATKSEDQCYGRKCVNNIKFNETK